MLSFPVNSHYSYAKHQKLTKNDVKCERGYTYKNVRPITYYDMQSLHIIGDRPSIFVNITSTMFKIFECRLAFENPNSMSRSISTIYVILALGYIIIIA